MKKKFPIILIVLSSILAVVSFLVLPETVTVQFGFGNSDPTTAPRLLAVLVPTVLGLGGGISALCASDSEHSNGRAILISGVGILVFAVMLMVNLIGK